MDLGLDLDLAWLDSHDTMAPPPLRPLLVPVLVLVMLILVLMLVLMLVLALVLEGEYCEK